MRMVDRKKNTKREAAGSKRTGRSNRSTSKKKQSNIEVKTQHDDLYGAKEFIHGLLIGLAVGFIIGSIIATL